MRGTGPYGSLPTKPVEGRECVRYIKMFAIVNTHEADMF